MRPLSAGQASAYAAAQRAACRVVVCTHGVFDLLHPGHVRYLREAASLATC